MKIGIGVTTYNRPEHLKLWQTKVKLSPLSYVYYVADDSKDRKGIAYRKNECLRALKDCDYIFLFDDDCFPIKAGWADFFIEASKVSSQQHFMYLKETPTIKKIATDGGTFFNTGTGQMSSPLIETYNNCSGTMMFLTKEVIEKVGGYGHYPNLYGMEHCGYTERIHKAGLTPLGKYTCPSGAGEYIYSLDLDNSLPINRTIKHEPSLSNEIAKVPQMIAEGHKYFQEDIKTIYRPL